MSSAPIRIAVVIPRFHPIFGGAENQCLLLNRELAATGDATVAMVLTRRHSMDDVPREDIGGSPVRRLGRPGMARWPEYGYYLHALAILLRERRRYDIIHCHAAGLVGFVMCIASMLARRPVILKLSANAVLMSGSLAAARGRGLRAAAGRAVKAFIARFSARHAHVVALNEQGRREVEEAGGRSVYTIFNGLDRDVFHPPAADERRAARASLGWRDDEIMLLFTGRFVGLKGLDTLLEAMRSGHLDRPGPRIRLCLVGTAEGQEDYPVDAMLSGMRKGFADRIEIHAPETPPLRFLHAADRFVFPSTREGMPNAVLEALACGLPCALSAIEPHREIVRHNPDAPIATFPVGDPERLAEAVYALPSRGSSGLSDSFDIRAIARQYVGLYRGIMEKHRAVDA